MQKPNFKWIITIAITIVIAVGGGATAIVAIPWKLDARYEQKVIAETKAKLLQEQLAARDAHYLERIGGMDRTYLQGRIDNLEWRLMTLISLSERRQLTAVERQMITQLRRTIARLKAQLGRTR